MARRRVLVLASTYPRWPGDPEPGFVHELARRLTGEFDIEVICPHAAGAATVEEMDGVTVRRYRYAPQGLETLVNDGGMLHNLRRAPWKWLLVPGFLLMQAVAILRSCARRRPDAIHAHWLVPQGFVAALLNSLRREPIPLLVTSHGSDLHALRGGLLTRLKGFAARRANAMTVVSSSMVDAALALGATPGTTAVLPMGTDLRDRFTPDPSVPRATNELLFVGRLVEKKGLKHLIDAMPAVLRAHPGTVLTVAGFGPDEAARREQVRALGLEEAVRFLGAVPQERLPALYRRATLLVAPFTEAASGDQEGFGLVVVEAMGCGCPVLVSDVPAAGDTVRHGDNGWLAKPGEPEDLSKQIRHLLADPEICSALAARAQRDALKFDWTGVATAHVKALNSLQVSRSPRR